MANHLARILLLSIIWTTLKPNSSLANNCDRVLGASKLILLDRGGAIKVERLVEGRGSSIIFERTNRGGLQYLWPKGSLTKEDLERGAFLDVGCGGGQTVLDLRRLGQTTIGRPYEAMGVDIKLSTELKRSEMKEIFFEADAVVHLPFPDNRFTRVQSWESVLSYYDPGNSNGEEQIWRSALVEIKRVTQKDGLIFFSMMGDRYKALDIVKDIGGLEFISQTAEDIRHNGIDSKLLLRKTD